jgi:hypothetical protein
MPIVYPAPHERAPVVRARAAITATVATALTATAAEIARKMRARKLRHRDDDFDDDDDDADRQADDIVKDTDLTGLHSIITAVGMALAYVALDQVGRTLARLGDLAAIEPDAQRAAVALGHNRAAALVGMRYADDGSLIENPNPKWSITSATRDMLHDTIAKGIAQGQSVDEIADAIVGSTTFSKARAMTVAQTEVSAIDNGAALAAFRTARDKGNVPLKKSWVTSGSDNVCDECQANEDSGPIDLDDTFDSGDDAPPLHPGCWCSISGNLDAD